MEAAFEAILGQSSAASFPTGPVIAEPFISPFGFTMTPALSKANNFDETFSFFLDKLPSQYMNVPSGLLQALLCLTTIACKTFYAGLERRLCDLRLPFFLSSGLPFLTEQRIISPSEAPGNLFK